MRTAEDLPRMGARLLRPWRDAAAPFRSPLPPFQLKFELALERARRCERPFALTRFVPSHGRPAPAWAEGFVAVAAPLVRACDAVGIVDGEAVVVWDDSDRPAATIAAKRLADAVDRPAEVATTVVFPDDGFTPAALFQALRTAGSTP